MATYNILDLQQRLYEIVQDGYLYADITEFKADDENPTCLHFEALESEDSYIDYEEIDSLTEVLPDDLSVAKFKPDDICHLINFSYRELTYIENALANTIDYATLCSKDDSYSKEEQEQFKADSIMFKDLHNKLYNFLDQLNIK